MPIPEGKLCKDVATMLFFTSPGAACPCNVIFFLPVIGFLWKKGSQVVLACSVLSLCHASALSIASCCVLWYLCFIIYSIFI